MISFPSKFCVDNDLPVSVAILLRESGSVAMTTRDLQFRRATDDEQLLVAAEATRVFVTHNERHFVLLHDAWQRWSKAWDVERKHGGIIIVPQGHKYGLHWSSEVISREILTIVSRGQPLSNELVLRKAAGWLRRGQGQWLVWP